MKIEEAKEMYEALKRGKDYIANIDKDFFFRFAETVFKELEKQQREVECEELSKEKGSDDEESKD